MSLCNYYTKLPRDFLLFYWIFTKGLIMGVLVMGGYGIRYINYKIGLWIAFFVYFYEFA